MAIIQAEIDAEDVIEAMLEDGDFARRVWSKLAEGLDAGQLFDDLASISASGGFDTAALRKIATQFQSVADLCAERLVDQ